MVLVVLGTWIPASAQTQPRGGVTVFTHSNFQGPNETFFGDSADLRDLGMNDQISSLRIPRGEVWEVCQDINFQGPCQTFSQSVSDLTSLNWNDKISSLRRVQGGNPANQANRPFNRGGGTARIFADPNYRGRAETVVNENANLEDIRFNDQVSSIEIPAGQVWEVCQDWQFANRCEVITRSVPNLGSIGMNDRISSLRRLPDNELSQSYPYDRYGRSDQYGAPRLILYAQPGYRGAARVVDQARTFGSFGNRAASVEIEGGVWEVCERDAARGNCVTLDSSVPDLARVGLTGPITSVRPVTGFGN
jgi:hypothetical protein